MMSATLIRLAVEVFSASDVTAFSSDTADGGSFVSSMNGLSETKDIVS